MSLYDDWYISAYNLLFTSTLITFNAIWDRDIHYQELKTEANKPHKTEKEIDMLDDSFTGMERVKTYFNIKNSFSVFYYLTQLNMYFSFNKFILEILAAIVQSLLICVVCTLSY